MDILLFNASQIYLCDYEEIVNTTAPNASLYINILKLERFDKYLRKYGLKMNKETLISDKLYLRKYRERIPILDTSQMMLPLYFYKLSNIKNDRNYILGLMMLYIDRECIADYIQKMGTINIVHTKPDLIHMAIQL